MVAEQQAPRATVVVPVLNNEAYVADALRSLMAQWQPDLELLVIDDGSTDGSFQRALDALRDAPGVAATLLRNAAPSGLGLIPQMLHHAAGPVIIQADSDDVALPGRLEAVLACFDADPACRLVTSNAVLLSPAGVPMGVWHPGLPDAVAGDPVAAAGMTGSHRWLGATSAFHRALLDGFPPLDTELLPYGIDLLLGLRATLTGSHHYLARPLVGWRQHGRNTHRLAGASSSRDRDVERHGAYELMAMARRNRDCEFLLAQSPSDTVLLQRVLAECHALFQRHFEDWARARNRLARAAAAPTEETPAPARLPPVAQLRLGHRYRFGTDGELGAVAECWDGMHPPEQGWNWTERTALLVFAVSGGGASTVTLGLTSPDTLSPGARRAEVSVNLGPFSAISVGADGASFGFPAAASNEPLLSLLIHVPDAIVPRDAGLSADPRLLGLMVDWIEVT